MEILDKLYHCFEDHLFQFDIEHEGHTEFVSNVVDNYLNNLREFGHICLQYENELREDIEVEVFSMLQKKIYGHFNIDHFRKALRQQKRCNNN